MLDKDLQPSAVEHNDLALDLSDLPTDVFDLRSDVQVESLTAGHGMSEHAASCTTCLCFCS